MAKTVERTILLQGRGYRLERPAAGTITPGHFVILDSNGELVVNSRARTKPYAIAVEDDLNGKDIDDNYVDNDYVQAEIVGRGCIVNALVAASAAALVIGDRVELAADGTVRKLTSLTDNSGGTANTTLQDISASPAEAEIANNFADLASWANSEEAAAIGIVMKAIDNSAGGSPARCQICLI
jgi:hypothetical protein